MKKMLLLVLVCLSIVLGYSFAVPNFFNEKKPIEEKKTPIVKIALVADSEDENQLLERALRQAQGLKINFVIGLGDWTQIGTIEQLAATKKVFDEAKLQYFVTAGDHDLWDSRNQNLDALTNFRQIFGDPTQTIEENGVRIMLLDNSDIYKGIAASDWQKLQKWTEDCRIAKLCLLFSHKTPFHPDSVHIMGDGSAEVAAQAKDFLSLLEKTQPCHSEFSSESKQQILKQVQDDKCAVVSGLFTGDLHFFAQFNSPSASVKITTIGAVASERNFQGPRFGLLTIYDDYSWKVEDVGI